MLIELYSYTFRDGILFDDEPIGMIAKLYRSSVTQDQRSILESGGVVQYMRNPCKRFTDPCYSTYIISGSRGLAKKELTKLKNFEKNRHSLSINEKLGD